MHDAARGLHVGGEALVVLHVARVVAPPGMLALELVEQFLGRLAHDVDQHVQPPAVGHADHDLLHALGAATVDDLVQRGDGGLAALQGEALLAGVLGVQVLLQPLRRGQPLQQAQLEVVRIGRVGARALQAGLDPALLVHVRDVHELRADVLGVGLLEHGDDIAQGLLGLAEQVAHVEGGVEVGLGQAMEGRVKVRDDGQPAQGDGVDQGAVVAEQAVGVDQAQHRGLLADVLGGRRRDPGGRAVLRGAGRRGPMRPLAHHAADVVQRGLFARGRFRALYIFEILPPGRRDRRGVSRELQVQLFNQFRITGFHEFLSDPRENQGP